MAGAQLMLGTRSDCGGLCEACETIPWSDLAHRKFPHEISPERIRPLVETHTALRKSTFPVCNILALIKPPDLDSETCWLSAVSSTIIREGSSIYTTKWKDCTYLAVEVKWPSTDSGRVLTEKNMYIALVKDGNEEDYVGTMRVSPAVINYDFIKEALAACHEKHENCHRAVAQDVISDLYVMDCETLNVVPAPPRCLYLALSYVWGTCDVVDSNNSGSESVLPAVIRDAIKVTLQLGYQYLWVDRLCILQTSAHKMGMINAMDKIYAGALLTIIDAAGTDSDYGLCGVDEQTRRPQAMVRIGDTVLLEHFSVDPHTLLTTSKWASRAWTLQEGLLSRRRLVFTNLEVFFVCRDTFLTESVRRPKEVTLSLDTKAFRGAETVVPSFRQMLEYSNKESLMQMKAHLSEYTWRSLRFEEDSLKAILGVLKLYAGKGVLHIWGLPVIKWGYMIQGIAVQLDWYHRQSTAVRRKDFPSWSYTGWSGAIDWTSEVFNYNDKEPFACAIFFTDGYGTLTPISSIGKHHLSAQNGGYVISKTLTISARMVPLTFKFVEQQQRPKRWARRWNPPHYPLPERGLFAVFPWSVGLSVCAVPFLDVDEALFKGKSLDDVEKALVSSSHTRPGAFQPFQNGVTGLILHMVNRESKHTKGAHSSTFMVLILHAMGSDTYERIGIMLLDIDEAPAYLDGDGEPLNSQPNMLQTVYWTESIWFRQSEERTVRLV